MLSRALPIPSNIDLDNAVACVNTWLASTMSPFCLVPRAYQVACAIESLMNRPLPSANKNVDAARVVALGVREARPIPVVTPERNARARVPWQPTLLLGVTTVLNIVMPTPP